MNFGTKIIKMDFLYVILSSFTTKAHGVQSFIDWTPVRHRNVQLRALCTNSHSITAAICSFFALAFSFFPSVFQFFMVASGKWMTWYFHWIFSTNIIFNEHEFCIVKYFKLTFMLNWTFRFHSKSLVFVIKFVFFLQT